MGLILHNDFSAGWIPSDSEVNGRKNGLLRMDNLELSKNGSLIVSRGTTKINPVTFSDPVQNCFSRYIYPTNYRFVALRSGDVLCDTAADGSFSTTILTGGSTWRTGFLAAYNNILVCSGSKRYKYNPVVSATPFLLGVGKPTAAPTLVADAPYTIDLTGTLASYSATSGTVAVDGSFLKVTADGATFIGGCSFSYASPTDTTSLSGSSTGDENDLFHITVKCEDYSKLQSIVVKFVNGSDASAYYVKEFTDFGTAAPDEVISLECKRSDFEKVGTDSTKNWKVVGAIEVNFAATGAIYVEFNAVSFNGGNKGPLSGVIEYVQVNINDQVGYIAASPMGPIATVELNQGSVTVTPQTPTTGDIQANKYQIYRRGGTLKQFYLVKTGSAASFADTLSDEDAKTLGVVLNERLAAVKDISDDVLALEGPFFNRVLYFTYKGIYISEINNPDSYDTGTGVLTPYGTKAEFFLWAKKVSNSVIWVGTTNDIYEISGTLTPFPDGSIDVNIRPLGIKQPPINDAVAVDSGRVFYCASDGWRQITSGGSESISANLQSLFNKKDCYGVNYVAINPSNYDTFCAAVTKNQLWTVVVLRDANRVFFVYDFLRNYWRLYDPSDNTYYNPFCLFVEEDGTLLGGYEDSGKYFLRKLDTGTGLDGTDKLAISAKTIFNSDGLSRNRKDSFTFKIKCNTGGENLTINIYKDESSTPISIGPVSSSALVEKILDISSAVGLAKSFAVELTGNFNTLEITDFSIDYEARPEQLTYFRSKPTNFESVARKRIADLPIVLDSLGSDVTLTWYVDGVAQTGVTINSSVKKTHHRYCSPEVVGTDFYYTLLCSTGVFEHYGQAKPTVTEVLPEPTLALTIPPTNLGTISRKRLVVFAFVINTNGANVVFTPSIDGVAGTPETYNTSRKQTVYYYFTANTKVVDISGTLVASTTTAFEYYGPNLEECVSEKLPPRTERLVIPVTNLGTIARKRVSAFAFIIDTNGANVTFTPEVEGVLGTPQTFNTNRKQTVVYYFTSAVKTVDIGGYLASSLPFEYYGPNLEECVYEKLPVRVKYFVIAQNNFGSASKKRLRTIPFVIDTEGHNVIYTPNGDGTLYPTTIFNSNDKKTLSHYFNTDVFLTDLGGTLSSDYPFEFYGMLQPESVEILPVAKLLDQLGPVEFNKLGRLLGLRVRVIAMGTRLDYTVFIEDVAKDSGTITTTPNADKVYDVPWLKRNLSGTTARIELSSPTPFHRYSGQIKVTLSGAQTDAKWIKL